MRPSPLRHTLAVLRTTIGLTQKEMAELAECSVPTIQAVELGKLPLTEKKAELIAVQTGVDIAWLLKDDISKPPINNRGAPYTSEMYEVYQALLLRKPYHADDMRWEIFGMQDCLGMSMILICAMMYGAQRAENTHLFNYKLRKAVEHLAKQFRIPKDLYTQMLQIWDSKPREAIKWDLLPQILKVVSEAVTDLNQFKTKHHAARLSRKVQSNAGATKPEDAAGHRQKQLARKHPLRSPK